MYLLDPTTAEQYLRERGHLDANEKVRVSELSGGVSNQVLLVERGRGDRFVLKQAREQLRVQQEWKCDVRRIWREIDVLRLCGEILNNKNERWGVPPLSSAGEQQWGQAPPLVPDNITATVPEILFEDRENFCYAMTAAPEGHRTWKEILLRGGVDRKFDNQVAEAVGGLLGSLHVRTWRNDHVGAKFLDRDYFDALRVDPYYREVSRRQPSLAPRIDDLIASLKAHACCLVHGDFSPKNLLVSDKQVSLIDFEVGHWGDPAFDLGFFFSHLLLKSMRAGPPAFHLRSAFSRARNSYKKHMREIAGTELSELEHRGVLNMAACLLARIDGKSPVDYLSPPQRDLVRKLAQNMLCSSDPHNLASAAYTFWDGMEPSGIFATMTKVAGRQVLDSRGKPTLEAEVWTDFTPWRPGESVPSLAGSAIVPSGASTGAAEAIELRDGDPDHYDGLGVKNAAASINTTLSNALAGLAVTDQQAIDRKLLELDPTPQKSKFGGNTLLAVSLAAAHAGANVRGVPLWQHLHDCFRAEAEHHSPLTTHSSPLTTHHSLPAPRMPLPMVNMISGGKHAGGNLDFQDVLIQPVGATDYPTQLEWIVRVYRRLGKLLNDAGYEGYLVGDEGGFGPRLKSNREAVEFVVRAIEAARLRPGDDVTIAIDVASSHFYRDGRYHLAAEKGRAVTSSEMIDVLESWVAEFPITSIEDGLAEDDWDGWGELTQRLGSRVRLVGDDLFATNEVRVRKGIELGVANSVLVKVNQIGTLTETFRTMLTAMSAGYTRVVSARSGETEDTTIADLAVAVGAESIKIGSIVRSERLAKYNRLLRIAEQLTH